MYRRLSIQPYKETIMDPHTESATPIVEQATDYNCFTKAKRNGEPTFTLRAQDVTADLVVDFWVNN